MNKLFTEWALSLDPELFDRVSDTIYLTNLSQSEVYNYFIENEKDFEDIVEPGYTISDYLGEQIVYKPASDKYQSELNNLKQRVKSMEKQVAWLSCLNCAGVDNWQGSDYAYELWEEDYESIYGQI